MRAKRKSGIGLEQRDKTVRAERETARRVSAADSQGGDDGAKNKQQNKSRGTQERGSGKARTQGREPENARWEFYAVGRYGSIEQEAGD